MSREESADLDALLELVRRLRAPDGCPWDRRQELADLRAYLLEEAHETADAIDRRDWTRLREELGDLLFQVAFIGRLAEEAGAFALRDAVAGIHRKMIERHPHVFGEAERLEDADAVREAWERRKLEEKRREGQQETSLLAGVPSSLPALVGAYRMTQKAAGVGFDWPTARDVLAKVEEEMAELGEAMETDDPNTESLREEIGDVLFTVANLARKFEIDPEAALAAANLKFRRRFAAVEKRLAETGGKLGEASLEQLDALWEQVKIRERSG